MHCLNNIEFPVHGIGALIECPHCGQQTELYDNDLFLPELTEQSFSRIKVRSSDGQTWYYVNLLEYTCSCPDFIGRRSEAPARHVFRICKHISHSLQPVYDKLSPIIKCIISEGRGVRPGEFRFDRNNNPVYITKPNEQGWINLFAPKRAAAKTYYSFGYNVVEKYWAYGQRPLINEADIYV